MIHSSPGQGVNFCQDIEGIIQTSIPRAPALQTPDLGNMPTPHIPTGADPYLQLIEASMLDPPDDINFANMLSPPFSFFPEGSSIQECAVLFDRKPLQYFTSIT